MVSKSKRRRLAAARKAAGPAAPAAPKPPRKKAAKKNKAAFGNGVRGMSTNTSSGVDLMGVFTVNSMLASGALLYSNALVPSTVDNSRVRLESSLWSKWRPKSIQVEITGSAPSTCGGSFVVAWTADPSYVLRSDPKLINFALAAERSKTSGFSGKCSLQLPVGTKWLDTTGHPEESGHGAIMCALISPPVGITGSVTFMVSLRWTIEWSGKEIVERIYSPEILVPDAGYMDLFTTSDGSFDSGYLTFKMHSGGSMVPFSGARPGMVYEVDKSTKVYFNKADGTVAECQYFARVVGYAVPGLLLFDTEELAREYTRTGDRTKAIAYHSASKVATPSTPRFVEVGVAAVGKVQRGDEVAELRQEVAVLKGFLRELVKSGQAQASNSGEPSKAGSSTSSTSVVAGVSTSTETPDVTVMTQNLYKILKINVSETDSFQEDA